MSTTPHLRLDELASAHLLPLALRLAGKPTDAFLGELLANQCLTPEQLAERQFAQLTKLVAHCYEHVPYYRTTFAELDIHPRDIRTLEDFSALPTVDKQTLREHSDQMRADDRRAEDLKVVYTGGSTGQPVPLHQDLAYYEMGWSAFQRNVLWTGFTPGERQAWFMRPTRTTLARRTRLALERKWVVGIALRSEKATAEWVRGMLKRRPRFVYGSATAIAALATYALEHDIRFESVTRVMTTSETLTPEMRADIVAAFDAPVFNQYGCTEVYAIASECTEGTMHINSDLNLVQFTPLTKPGGLETHELVVTPLYAFAEPLLRFRSGDQADPIEGLCPCGLPFPLMGMVEGRIDDTMTFSGGAKVSAMLLERMVRPIPGVARFQFRQTSRDTLQLLVVADHRFDDHSRALLKDTQERFARQAGITIDIDPVLVDEIEALPNGKHRSVIRLEDETPR